jgi:hypothetical protein
MFKSLLTVIAVLTVMQSPATQAAGENFSKEEECLKQEISIAKKQACKVLNTVPPQYKNTRIEAAYEYFCGVSQLYSTSSPETPDQVAWLLDEAISGLIDAENGLPIGDLEQWQFSDRISKLMSLRTDVHIAELHCSPLFQGL